MLADVCTVLLNGIRSIESSLSPAPVDIPVFLGLHGARRVRDSRDRISLSSAVVRSLCVRKCA